MDVKDYKNKVKNYFDLLVEKETAKRMKLGEEAIKAKLEREKREHDERRQQFSYNKQEETRRQWLHGGKTRKNYNHYEMRDIIRNLHKNSITKNKKKMVYYLNLIGENFKIYDRVINMYGLEWLKEQYETYIFSDYDETPFFLKPGYTFAKIDPTGTTGGVAQTVCGNPWRRGKRKSPIRRISARDFMDYLRETGKYRRYKKYHRSRSSKDLYADMDPPRCITQPAKRRFPPEYVDMIHRKLEKISMDNIQPFKLIDLLREKKDLAFGDKVYIRKYEERLKEEEEKKKREEEEAFIVAHSLRKYGNEVQPEPESNPVVAYEREQFEKFTNDVGTYRFNSQFPIMRVVDYMVDFCDEKEISTFERLNPTVKSSIEHAWRRKCKLDFDAEKIIGGTTWKETYMSYCAYMKGVNRRTGGPR
ncbi:hypothetical protein ACOME3_005145 [Neoechinorhynchus agilis]